MGRRIGPRLGSDDASSFSVMPAGHSLARSSRAVESPSEIAVPTAPRSERRAPFSYTAERLAQVWAKLAPPKVIGKTPEGLRVNFAITGGWISGERFNATVEAGGADCLRIREDGMGIVAVRTTLKTDDGAIVYAEYSGVLDLGEGGYQNAINGRYPSKPRVRLAPRFLCASPAYAWLNRLQCIGIGYVTMASLEVDYDLYVMDVPETGAQIVTVV
jgi:hypothetical protein